MQHRWSRLTLLFVTLSFKMKTFSLHALVYLVADVLKFLQDLPRGPLQVFRNLFLLLRRQLGVLLAQIPIDHILHLRRSIVRWQQILQNRLRQVRQRPGPSINCSYSREGLHAGLPRITIKVWRDPLPGSTNP